MTPDDRVAWMRRLGVIQATWTDGDLTSCLLGPEPEPITDTPAPSAEARRKDDDDILFGAS